MRRRPIYALLLPLVVSILIRVRAGADVDIQLTGVPD